MAIVVNDATSVIQTIGDINFQVACILVYLIYLRITVGKKVVADIVNVFSVVLVSIARSFG